MDRDRELCTKAASLHSGLTLLHFGNGSQVTSAGCAPQKVHPALIACFRLATVGCFWPIFFFADHNEAWHTLAGVCIPSLNASLALPV